MLRDNTRRMPRLRTGTGEILARVAGAQATARRDCEANTAILAGDTSRLLAEITWLCRSLRRSRQRAANLEAAIRAALSAHDDGEDDPLGVSARRNIPRRRGPAWRVTLTGGICAACGAPCARTAAI